jgi:hypothetical protein
MRYRIKDVWIWADAVCINQNDEEEKSQQLFKMPDLLEFAALLVVHLSEYTSLTCFTPSPPPLTHSPFTRSFYYLASAYHSREA